MRKIHFFITMSLLVAICACSTGKHDARLDMVDRLAAESPRSALDSLAAIERDILSEADSHYYDLLTIKCADKAYITHTSDSLILNVIDWYAEHKSGHLYPEALYYGGRVYSDLGDYPTALKYFQDALDEVEDNDNKELYNRILSQTGRLLERIGLHNEAIPYLQECLEASASMGEEDVSPYDYQLLGGLYMRIKAFDKADSCFRIAEKKVAGYPLADRAFMRGFRAVNKYYAGDIDSALILMRSVPESVEDPERPYFSCYMTRVYLALEKPDSAYFYVRDILRDKDPNYKTIGYSLLLDPQLAVFSDPDTLSRYAEDYHAALIMRDQRTEGSAALLQNSAYNYSIHERNSAKLEKARDRMLDGLMFTALLVLLLCCIIIYLKYRYAQKQVSMEKLQTRIAELKSRLDKFENYPDESKKTDGDNACILNEAKEIVQSYLDKNNLFGETDPNWLKVSSIIASVSPSFENLLNQIAKEPLSRQDVHLALLIRLGIPAIQIAQLFGRTKSTISYQRKQLCKKLFADGISIKDFDATIASL